MKVLVVILRGSASNSFVREFVDDCDMDSWRIWTEAAGYIVQFWTIDRSKQLYPSLLEF